MTHAAFQAGRGAFVSNSPPNPVPRDFPPLIQRALARISGRVGTLSELPANQRALLAEFVRSASVSRPTDAIRVRVESLAIAMGCSARTVARLKADLELSGWVRRHQTITRRRGAEVADVWFTEPALQALGLQGGAGKASHMPAAASGPSTILSQPGPTPAGRQHAQRAPSVADACIDFKEQPYQGHPAPPQVVHKGVQKKTCMDATRRTQPTRADAAASAQRAPHRIALPEPLRWLASHMSAVRVCWLMRQARVRGVLLEDLAEVCRHQIAAAQNAFAYIRALLERDRDWAFARRDHHAQQAAAAEAEERSEGENGEQARLAQRLQHLMGRNFLGEDGLVRRVGAGFAEVFTVPEAAKALGRPLGSRPLSAGFVKALDDGRLQPWSPPC